MTKSIPELLAEYETRLLKDRLFEYPGRIYHKKEELYQARRQLTEVQNIRAEEEALLKTMIAAEMNPDTRKPTYSNVEARAAELINRKKLSTEYQQTEKACSDAEAAVNTLQFDLERLQDEFRSYRYVVDLTARELAFLASDCLAGDGNGAGSGNGRSQQRQPY